MKKDLTTQLNKLDRQITKLQKERDVVYKALVKIQEEEDANRVNAIADGEIDWDVVMMGNPTTILFDYQNKIINQLGLFRGGFWRAINQISITLTKRMLNKDNRENTLKSLMLILPHYKTMSSEFDKANIVPFETHDKHLSERGSYTVEIDKDLMKVRILRRYYSKPEVFMDWIDFNLDALRTIKKKIM